MHNPTASVTLFLLLAAGQARAAVVETFATLDAFLARVPVSASETVTFGGAGSGPVIDLAGSAPAVQAGPVRIEATSGGLSGDRWTLSAEAEGAALILTFARPLRALGLTGSVVGETRRSMSGSLLLEVAGGVTVLPSTSAVLPVPSSIDFRGVVSDAAFSVARIAVADFDQAEAPAVFAGLTDALHLGFAPPAAVPAPGFTALLAPVLALAVSRRGGRRDAAAHRRRGGEQVRGGKRETDGAARPHQGAASGRPEPRSAGRLVERFTSPPGSAGGSVRRSASARRNDTATQPEPASAAATTPTGAAATDPRRADGRRSGTGSTGQARSDNARVTHPTVRPDGGRGPTPGRAPHPVPAWP